MGVILENHTHHVGVGEFLIDQVIDGDSPG